MRLIDSDEFGVISLQGKSEEFIDGVLFMFDKIHEAPTVEERPHGEWVLDKEISFVFNMYECSKCRFNGSKRWHFCPNCGADMRVKTDFN